MAVLLQLRAARAAGEQAEPLARLLLPAENGDGRLLAGRHHRGAGEGIRTLDVNLGKVALYH
jgi:hypothetical protein